MSEQSFIINETFKQCITNIFGDNGEFVRLLQDFITKLKFDNSGNSQIIAKYEKVENDRYKVSQEYLETELQALEVSDIFKNFVEDTFYLADCKSVYKLLHFLIKHQTKVIQYFRIFPYIYKDLPEDIKKQLEHYYNYAENILKHDSDKLNNPVVIKYYFIDAIMEEIVKELKKIQDVDNSSLIKVISTISTLSKRIHGHNNPHHNEYYVLHTNELKTLKQNPLLALEFVLDTASMNDKYNQRYGSWYECYRGKDIDLCRPMRISHDKLITEIYKLLNEYFYSKLSPKDKLNSLEHSKRVYSLLKDNYDFNMEFIKSVNRNLALLFVKSWKETKDIVSIEDLTGQSKKLKEKRERLLTSLSSIDKFKQRILDEKFDLKTIISDIKKITNREVRLMELSAILSVFKEKNELLKETCIEEFKTLIYKDLTEDENEELKKLQSSTKDLLKYESEDEFYIATKNDCPYIF